VRTLRLQILRPLAITTGTELSEAAEQRMREQPDHYGDDASPPEVATQDDELRFAAEARMRENDEAYRD
jgi:hypothetical protein